MHQTTQQVNKHWHDRKGWEKESNTVKGDKIKQDAHFTTLKRFKIIKLTKSCTFYDVCLFFSSLSIFVYVEKI
jgi:hypothetical protein